MTSEANPVNGPIPSIIIPRAEHNISRANIAPNALKVLYRLKSAGYQAYLVGGGVRDLLLGREPKDFDVGTNARPEEVRQLFRNCRLIGRRFRLAHVIFGREVVEVATFRARHAEEDDAADQRVLEDGRILRDNVYGTLEEDAWRRDFTVNALYYNIDDFSVVDQVGGMADLRAGTLRLIGDPVSRYREDAVRMLRAVRFAAKLGFRIHPDSEAPLWELGPLLRDIPPARLYEEVLKLFLGGSAVTTYELLRHYRLFGELFPPTEDALSREEAGFPHVLLTRALENTDARVVEDKPVTPAFLFAALLWLPVRERAGELAAAEHTPVQAVQVAGDEVVREQAGHISIPRRFSLPMREIWTLQPRLERDQGSRRALRLLGHPRFRAAYDFLVLRAEAGEVEPDVAHWWEEFQTLEDAEQERRTRGDKPRRRRRRRRSRRGGGDGDAS